MEIKINDDGTALIDGVVYRKEEGELVEGAHKVASDNPLFYPKKGELAGVLNSMADSFLNAKVITHASCDDIITPRLKPETAHRVAWGMSRLAEWQAMGVGIGEDGEDRWFIDRWGDSYLTHKDKEKSAQDALFLTQKDLTEALEKFGGIEALQEARLARWGK